jgi:hypothetical protein
MAFVFALSSFRSQQPPSFPGRIGKSRVAPAKAGLALPGWSAKVIYELYLPEELSGLFTLDPRKLEEEEVINGVRYLKQAPKQPHTDFWRASYAWAF